MTTTPLPPTAHPLLRCLDGLDAFTLCSGRPLGWLNVGMVVLTCLVVLLRYAFNHSSVPLQEASMYLHAIAFMLGSAYALQRNEHVRVDIFYQRFSVTKKAWVDLLGTLLLTIPVMSFIAWSSWGYVNSAWTVHEVSQEATGLPWVYLLKTLIPLMSLAMCIQALAEILRNIAILRGLRAPQATESPTV